MITVCRFRLKNMEGAKVINLPIHHHRPGPIAHHYHPAAYEREREKEEQEEKKG